MCQWLVDELCSNIMDLVLCNSDMKESKAIWGLSFLCVLLKAKGIGTYDPSGSSEKFFIILWYSVHIKKY